jgi:hypothetical protein
MSHPPDVNPPALHHSGGNLGIWLALSPAGILGQLTQKLGADFPFGFDFSLPLQVPANFSIPILVPERRIFTT